MKRTKRRGHGVGKDSVSISTSIPIAVDVELRKLAAASELTRGGYARDAIIEAVKSGHLRKVTRTKISDHKIVEYPLEDPENPDDGDADRISK